MTLKNIISEAFLSGASDIHFEPLCSCVRVRFRRMGILSVFCTMTAEEYSVIFNIISAEANLALSKNGTHDGALNYVIDEKPLNIRLSVIPTVYGLKTELRLMLRDPDIYFSDNADFDPKEYKTVLKLINLSKGLILLTGPTGSGKTTTLYSFLKRLNNESRNIVTIEDPVEYIINGINQTQTDDLRGYGFSEGLKAVLRQDPDIIMVGEIRDPQTAKTAVNAAISGRLVFSTLHTGDSIGVISRLVNMGVSPYLIMEALAAAVSQRLVNILCDGCKVKRGGYFESHGCEKCGGTGISRRIAIFETYIPTDSDRDYVYSSSEFRGLEPIREAAVRNGMVTVRDKIRRLLDDGNISLSEAVRTGGSDILNGG